MISAEVGPPSSIVAAWITQRAGMSPAVVSTASPSPIGARSSDSRWTAGPAGARDRRGHPAAVQQLGVGGVGDRVDLELRHVRRDDLQLRPLRDGSRVADVDLRRVPFVVRVNAAKGAAPTREVRP